MSVFVSRVATFALEIIQCILSTKDSDVKAIGKRVCCRILTGEERFALQGVAPSKAMMDAAGDSAMKLSGNAFPPNLLASCLAPLAQTIINSKAFKEKCSSVKTGLLQIFSGMICSKHSTRQGRAIDSFYFVCLLFCISRCF